MPQTLDDNKESTQPCVRLTFLLVQPVLASPALTVPTFLSPNPPMQWERQDTVSLGDGFRPQEPKQKIAVKAEHQLYFNRGPKAEREMAPFHSFREGAEAKYFDRKTEAESEMAYKCEPHHTSLEDDEAHSWGNFGQYAEYELEPHRRHFSSSSMLIKSESYPKQDAKRGQQHLSSKLQTRSLYQSPELHPERGLKRDRQSDYVYKNEIVSGWHQPSEDEDFARTGLHPDSKQIERRRFIIGTSRVSSQLESSTETLDTFPVRPSFQYTATSLPAIQDLHPERIYQCRQCPKRYKNKCTLQRHTRIHTGENMLSCSYCKKLYFDKATLTVHLRTHTGERPFQCQLCGHAFVQKSDLSRHITSLHCKEDATQV